MGHIGETGGIVMKKKYVVFDMDGVLFDSERLIQRCWKEVGAHYGLPEIGETFLRCVGTTRVHTRRVFHERYPEFSYDVFQEGCRELFFGEIEETGMPLKPGAREILSHLQERGDGIALASSTRRELVECELKSVDLMRYFDQIVTGDQLERSKPAPDIYLMACRALEVAPEKSWAIEDSYNGIRAAAAAGMKAIMVPDLLPPTREMEVLKATILPNLATTQVYLDRQE